MCICICVFLLSALNKYKNSSTFQYVLTGNKSKDGIDTLFK